MGVPPSSRDGLSWKIQLKWMMTRGTPIYGNDHILEYHGNESWEYRETVMHWEIYVSECQIRRTT